MGGLFFPIHGRWVKNSRGGRLEGERSGVGGVGTRGDATIEAGFVAVVASGPADVFDLEQDDILIAVDPKFFNELGVAGFLALDPELVPGSTPISRFFCTEGMGQRLGVHESEHQDLVGKVVARDAGNQPVGGELWLELGAKLDLGVRGSGGEDVGTHSRERD